MKNALEKIDHKMADLPNLIPDFIINDKQFSAIYLDMIIHHLPSDEIIVTDIEGKFLFELDPPTLTDFFSLILKRSPERPTNNDIIFFLRRSIYDWIYPMLIKIFEEHPLGNAILSNDRIGTNVKHQLIVRENKLLINDFSMPRSAIEQLGVKLEEFLIWIWKDPTLTETAIRERYKDLI